jgi:hypothetical protein
LFFLTQLHVLKKKIKQVNVTNGLTLPRGPFESQLKDHVMSEEYWFRKHDDMN